MGRPLVLELKANSLDDGPGIRTAIFFKGCPLDCIWCHNPESKKAGPELSVSMDECIGCFTCKNVCPLGAAGPDRPGIVDRSICDNCFLCTETCPPKGLQRVGIEMPMDEIVARCVSDKVFFDVSGGGVTISGGEPTLFPEWVGELCQKLNDAGIRIHMETSGMFDYEKVREHILPHLSSIYMDIKIMDREKHRKYCGIYNDTIAISKESPFYTDELKAALQDCFINIINTDEGKAIFSVYSHEGYKKAVDSDYDATRKAQEVVK